MLFLLYGIVFYFTLPKIAELSLAQIGSRFDGESCFPTGLAHGFE